MLLKVFLKLVKAVKKYHGRAVAIGLLYIALLSRQEKILDNESVNFIYNCLKDEVY